MIQHFELINGTNIILYLWTNSLSYFFPNCSYFIDCLFSITLLFRFMESTCNYHILHLMQWIYFTGQLYAFSVTCFLLQLKTNFLIALVHVVVLRSFSKLLWFLHLYVRHVWCGTNSMILQVKSLEQTLISYGCSFEDCNLPLHHILAIEF